MADLTPKQQAFVREYLIDWNATQAAIRAGYSAKTAEVQGPRLLGNVRVQAAIAEGQKAINERTEINQDWVRDRLVQVVDRCLQNEAVQDDEGNPTGEYRFNAAGANKALEILARHTGLIGPASSEQPASVNLNVGNMQINVDVTQVTADVDELLNEFLGQPTGQPPFDA